MSDSRTWKVDRPIPHVDNPGNAEQYAGASILEEITRLRGSGIGNSAPDHLLAAGGSWGSASEKLQQVQRTLRAVGEGLADAWQAEASVDCQEALLLMYEAADRLANAAHYVAAFTNAAADSLRTAVTTFPSADDPGRMETGMRHAGLHGPYGNPITAGASAVVGRGIDNTLDFLGLGEDPDRKYRDALARLNQQYVADSQLMPGRVSATLPIIDHGGVFQPGTPPPGGGGGGLPELGDGVGVGPGPGGITAPERDALPPAGFESPQTDLPAPDGRSIDAGAGPTAFGSGTGLDPGGLGDGYTGGLAGAGGGMGAGGAGVGPAGGTGGAAGGGLPSGGGAGLGGGGLGAGVGATGAGIAGGKAAAAGGPRPGGTAGGMVPMAGGAGAKGGGGRGAPGTGAAGARPGMAGGMMPMGGAGRGAGQQPDQHDSWLVEDDDPWGADDNDAPPGIVR